MNKLNKYFLRGEFACHCNCGFDVVDTELLELLTAIRCKFGPVVINSACRCDSHNRNCGGSQRSQHKLGKAADIVTGHPPALVYAWLDGQYPNEYGFGEYKNFVHVDVRDVKARWFGKSL